jgi:hypothetical protein
MIRTISTTCPYCGVSAEVGDAGVSIAGDKAHPANLGRLCVKGSSLAQTLTLEERLLHPRIGGEAGDESADLYALGVTVYRLFARAYPYGEIEPFSKPRFGAPASLTARVRTCPPGWTRPSPGPSPSIPPNGIAMCWNSPSKSRMARDPAGPPRREKNLCMRKTRCCSGRACARCCCWR